MMIPAELSKPIHCSPAETEYFDISQEDTVPRTAPPGSTSGLCSTPAPSAQIIARS